MQNICNKRKKHFDNEFTTIFYAANSGKIMIRVLSDDTDAFVLLGCWVYWEEEYKMQVEQWDMTWCWATDRAWHACPQQLRHDLISIRQSRDQCTKHLAQWRVLRIMHWGSVDDAGISDGDSNTCFIVLHGLSQGTSMESVHFTLQQEEVPKSKPCLQHQPTCSCICCVPICRSCCRKRRWYLSVRLGDLGWHPRCCCCLGWPMSTVPVSCDSLWV